MWRTRIAVGLLALFGSAGAQERFLVDWDETSEEALVHLSALIRINSTNPPGNESLVAGYVSAALANEGIESSVHEMEPGRANLVARVRGNGSKRPILFMGHTDVVGVQADRWAEDPFGGLRKDGWVYGRGALDDKDSVTAGMMLLILLKRHAVPLDRDIIFLAEAGEEGTPDVGINYMVQHHWDEIDAEFALAEGGGGIIKDENPHVVSVQTTEKMPRRVTLVAHGTAGHGSVPRLDNAVSILANAVARASAWQTEMRLNETTETYFERLATISSDEDAFRYRNIRNPDYSAAIQQHFLENDPHNYSLLRTSVVPTVISAGFRNNVIPSEASAWLDIRMLPDENVEAFYRQLAAVIDDSRVEIVPEPIYRPAAPSSGIDNAMFNSLERISAIVYPGAAVLPTMSTGATDMAQVRARGIPAYGIGPLRSVEELSSGNGAHSDNERVSEQAFRDYLRFVWLTIIDVAVDQSARN